MSEDQFAKLYTYMQEQFGQIREALDSKADKSQGDQILNILDGFANRLEADEHERAAASDQLDRHEVWIGQLAENTDTKLAPEL